MTSTLPGHEKIIVVIRIKIITATIAKQTLPNATNFQEKIQDEIIP